MERIKQIVPKFLILFFLIPFFTTLCSREDFADRDTIFEEGKEEFFKELELKLGIHPLKFRLSRENIKRLENAETEIPFLYENLINITYLEESLEFDDLIEEGSKESMERFRERYIQLSKETANRFIRSLFQENSTKKILNQESVTFGTSRLDRVLLSFRKKDSASDSIGKGKPSWISTTGLEKTWGFRISRFKEAHKFSRGRSVKIGVIDSGIAIESDRLKLDHLDLDKSFSLVGRKDPPWIKEAVPIDDEVGHGTIAISLLSALAPESEITVYKVKYDPNASYSYWSAMQVAQAIYRAIYDRADVLLISAVFGVDYTFLKEACQFAYESGVIIICPNGNLSEKNPEVPQYFPAHYVTTVAVAGVVPSKEDKPIAWKMSGESFYTSVAASATIYDIDGIKEVIPESMIRDNSWAAAFTCGLVALISSQISKTGEDLKGQYFQRIYEIVTRSANPHILGFKKFLPKAGYGLIDAEKSVNEGLKSYLVKMKQVEENFKKRMEEIAKREQEEKTKREEKKE